MNKGNPILINFENIPKTPLCMCKRCRKLINRSDRKKHSTECPKALTNNLSMLKKPWVLLKKKL